MEAAINQIKNIVQSVDDDTRRKLITELRDLSYTLEKPDDTVQRVSFYHLRAAAVRTGIDLKLFDILAEQSPRTTDELQRATGADVTLLGRLLRYLASVSMVQEVGTDVFAATNITKTLATPGNQAGLRHVWDVHGPNLQAMPKWLADHDYPHITENTDTVHQMGHQTPLSGFLWLVQQPSLMKDFNDYMAHRASRLRSWLDVYPIEQETQDWNPNAPLFVDVGGNVGHLCAELKGRYPNLPGEVVLQDQEHPIKMALPTPGVRNMVHDFFEPQPVKGAKYYFLSHVLHDWPDEKCRVILNQIKATMGPDSVILLNEMMLPNEGVDWHATQIDLAMMVCLASIERTESMWSTLLDSVGLKILSARTFEPAYHETIIAVAPK